MNSTGVFSLSKHRVRAFALLAAIPVILLGQKAEAQQVVIRRPQAIQIARQKGWVIRKEIPPFTTIELQYIVNGIPLYYTTNNLDAADSVSTDECWPGGSSVYGLSGSGVTLGVWDGGGVRTAHQEFTPSRAIQVDAPAGFSAHSTHVAGTMIAAGASAQAKGMSFAGLLDCYDWTSDEGEMGAAAAAGLRVSNHSYSLITGWYHGDLGAGTGWYWTGDITVSTVEDYDFGFYGFQSKDWDTIAYNNPYYLFVKAAANEREDAHTGTHFHWDPGVGDWVSDDDAHGPDGDYDCIGGAGVSKNGLTIGAVNDVNGGYSVPGGVTMTSFSSWGPADDGRIKPDVVGNGASLYSSVSSSNSAYGSMSGTSMASPNVAGSLGLLIEHQRATHLGADMRAATLKGLLIHTADEAGSNPGPDYSFGWGLANTLHAADHIALDTTNPEAIQELVLAPDQTISQTWTYSGDGPFKATICWTDPPGTSPLPALDPPDKALVNDLDLRVIGPGPTTYEPWILDPTTPTAAAAKGDNDTDNIEVVVIDSPEAGSYEVEITHKGTLFPAAQPFSLILSGTVTGPQPTGACCCDDICTHTVEESACLAKPGGCTWFGAQVCPSWTCFPDCNWNEIPDECDIDCGAPGCDPPPDCGGSTDCNGNAVPDECDISSGMSTDYNGNGVPDDCEPDCNGNGVPDECDVSCAGSCAEAPGCGTSPDCQSDGLPDECQATGVYVPAPDPSCSPAADNGEPWCDDFESYPLGTISGNNWEGWGNDPNALGTVTNAQNRTDTGLNSLKIVVHDTVRLFNGYDLTTSSCWLLRAYVYVPATMTGEAFFIVNPDYTDGGTDTTWAVQLKMNTATGRIDSEYGGLEWLPLVTDAWVEIRCEIKFAANLVTIHYDGKFLTSYPWTVGGGSLSISALDLFSPDSSGFYYDDLSLFPAVNNDCNGNSIPDECDVPESAGCPEGLCTESCSEDGDENCIPDECECPPSSVPQAEMIIDQAKILVVNKKNRFLSFAAGDEGLQKMIQVKFLELAGDYGQFNDESMWVGDPFKVSESPAQAAPGLPGYPDFWAAKLQCEKPVPVDWTTLTGDCFNGVCYHSENSGEACTDDSECVRAIIHVYGEFVIPGSNYEIRVLDSSCPQEAIDNPAIAPPLELATSMWGDVCGVYLVNGVWPAPDGACLVSSDVIAVLSKVALHALAPSKTRADVIGPEVPKNMQPDLKVDIYPDIIRVLSACAARPFPAPKPLWPCP